MPRVSPYRIELTRAEQEELEARARRYTSPYRDVVRAKLVLLAAQGMSNDVIAARLDLLRQVVSKWRNRLDRKSTRLNSSHSQISYAVFCLKKKKTSKQMHPGSAPITRETEYFPSYSAMSMPMKCSSESKREAACALHSPVSSARLQPLHKT